MFDTRCLTQRLINSYITLNQRVRQLTKKLRTAVTGEYKPGITTRLGVERVSVQHKETIENQCSSQREDRDILL